MKARGRKYALSVEISKQKSKNNSQRAKNGERISGKRK